jgi:hypothetical protein
MAAAGGRCERHSGERKRCVSFPAWVSVVSGVPAAALFSSTQGLGSPIIIDEATDTPYYLKAGVPTPFAAGPASGFEFPVGYIYISIDGTDPSTVLGYGTWAAFGAGRTLVSLNPADPDFDTAEELRGAKTVASAGSVAAPTLSGSSGSATTGITVSDHAAHTHSVTSNVTVSDHASHTHGVTSNVTVDNHASHTHTYTEVPNHVHVQNVNTGTTGGSNGYGVDTSTNGSGATAISTANPTGGVATGTTAGPSATLSHTVTNNAVTSAGPSATLTHSVTNNAVTSGNPSATLTHAVNDSGHTHGVGTFAASAPAFTGSATSVVQPSIVVYMWKRTA